MQLRELDTIYSSQVSFYGKAQTVRGDNNVIHLFSYDTEIATAYDNDITLVSKWEDDYSRTTMRHLNEFARQYSRVGKLGIKDIRKALSGNMIIKGE